MNIICVVVICLMTETLGVALFDLKTFPSWANVTETPAGTDCLTTAFYSSTPSLL